MNELGQLERATQNRVVALYKDTLGYEYLGNWEKRTHNKNIEDAYLTSFLQRQGYSDQLIQQAKHLLDKAANNLSKGLYDANKAVYNLLRYGAKVKEEAHTQTQTVWLIDWDEPHNNHFAIAEEVTVQGKNKKRPDIVLYVNGIALAVLELKRSTVAVEEGIRQNIDNQQEEFIQSFFSTIQLTLGGNDSQGLRYGVVGTPAKYYLEWKEETPNPLAEQQKTTLDQHIVQLCTRARLLELIRDFITYDGGIKKICRPHQYFGIKAAQKSLRQREGGIIWHTQGSGKSLTMVWLAKWIRENITGSRVLIITDRTELDKQIEGVFLGVDEQIKRSRSGAELVSLLNSSTDWLLCSLIHKFGNKDENDYNSYADELLRARPRDFAAKGDIYVFVDECHRTQSGALHEAMKQLLPNACFVGFTGTPLLKSDKQKSIEVFGKYIHTYKFDQAVSDGVVLDLCYEARDVEQQIKSAKKIDEWFDAKTKGLTDYAKAELKKRWGTMQNILSSKSRLGEIVSDIILDMNTKPRLSNGRGNAILVSGSIYEACKYYELFQDTELKGKCAIITSYNPSANKIKGEHTGAATPTDELRQYRTYIEMLAGKTSEAFEDEAKQQFVNEPARMKLLIVVDKLLTGFDAPSCTYLYIDKKMQDHKLFQAICRVNRLDGEDKEYGYIVDYKDLFKSLERSMHDYTSNAFDAYEQADIQGLISNRLDKAKERLDAAKEAVFALLEQVAPPRQEEDYLVYFCGHAANPQSIKDTAPRRATLYKQTAGLLRAYANIADDIELAGYTASEATHIKNYVTDAQRLRDAVKLRSGDYIDLKAYESDMRHLIDTYIGANESEKISYFDNKTLVELLVEQPASTIAAHLPPYIRHNEESIAETIENNVRKLIIDEMPTNPAYYQEMSKLLDNLIKARQERTKNYHEYLEAIAQLCKQTANPNQSEQYPKELNTAALRALYDNLHRDLSLALQVDKAIRSVKKADWRDLLFKRRSVFNAIQGILQQEEQAEAIFKIVVEQKDY